MKVLVCGGRDCFRRDLVFGTLDNLHAARGITGVIEGGAPGIDGLAYEWALAAGLHLKTYRADWNTHGPAAGPIRNRQMLADGNPDLVLAFPGGRGTAHMVKTARVAGVEVMEISLTDPASVTAHPAQCPGRRVNHKTASQPLNPREGET